MDRTGLVSAQAENRSRRGFWDRLVGLAVIVGGFAKFFAFFVSFAAYSLLWHSWKVGLGVVLLILVHELGHVAEARRQGLAVTLPTFIPFLGAYVTVRHAGGPPWRSALISLAGPFVGGLGAAAVWAVGSARDTSWLVVLANFGFLLNAFNMLPIGFLDGGTVFQAISASRRGWIRYEHDVPVEAMPPDRAHANLVMFLYLALGAALVGGLLATRHSGML
jgi:Zn-dependent protease